MLNNYFSRSPLESSTVFWKSEENFDLEELTNTVLVGDNFTADVAMWISETYKTIPTAVSFGEFIDQLLLKIISLQQKRTGHLIFWRNKDSKFLLDRLQLKKKKKNE